jgi:hypothetical protein
VCARREEKGRSEKEYEQQENNMMSKDIRNKKRKARQYLRGKEERKITAPTQTGENRSIPPQLAETFQPIAAHSGVPHHKHEHKRQQKQQQWSKNNNNNNKVTITTTTTMTTTTRTFPAQDDAK